jgi:hypothetical protein
MILLYPEQETRERSNKAKMRIKQEYFFIQQTPFSIVQIDYITK